MPTYEYHCGACGARVDIFHSMSEAPRKKCPECGKSKLVRQIGAGAGILFRGSGFYQTDYRSESYRKAESADKPGCTGDTKSCADSGGPCAAPASPDAKSAKPAPEKKPAAKKKD
jgi:putative FmdB family regulatory protein